MPIRYIEGVPTVAFDEELDQLKVQIQDIDVLLRLLVNFLSGLRKDSVGRLVVNPESTVVVASPTTGVATTSWGVNVVPGTYTGMVDFAIMHTAMQFQQGQRQHLLFS